MRAFCRPSTQWDIISSLYNRSFGTEEPNLFRDKANGSRQLVSRLVKAHELKHHDGCVNALNFDETGILICSGSDDLNVAVWDWERSDAVPKISYDSGHTSNVFQTKFMPNTCSSTIVSSARDGQVRVGFLTSQGCVQQTKRVAQHKCSVHKVSVEPGSPNLLLSAGEDAVVLSIDLRQPEPDKILTLHNQKNKRVPLYAIHINPVNPCEFAVCGRDPWARIYDRRKISMELENGYIRRYCTDHLKNSESLHANITSLSYSHDGAELLCTYSNDDIYLFDTGFSSESEAIKTYKGHRNIETVKGVNFFGPRSEFVVSGSDCGHIYIWDKESARVIQFLEGDRAGVVNVLEPHPHCCVLATSGLDPEVKVWLPVGEPFSNFDKLQEQMKVNEEKREEERERPVDIYNNQLILVMMRHFQRQRRRFVRRSAHEEGEEVSTDSDMTDSDMEEESDSDSDEDGEGHDASAPSACVQS